MQGVFFVISVFLQQESGYSAIQTGLTLVPATIGILLSSAMARRMVSRHPQRLLIRAGNAPFLAAIIVVGAFAVIGWIAVLLIPHEARRARRPRETWSRAARHSPRRDEAGPPGPGQAHPRRSRSPGTRRPRRT
jgi:hypothetical protein